MAGPELFVITEFRCAFVLNGSLSEKLHKRSTTTTAATTQQKAATTQQQQQQQHLVTGTESLTFKFQGLKKESYKNFNPHFYGKKK